MTVEQPLANVYSLNVHKAANDERARRVSACLLYNNVFPIGQGIAHTLADLADDYGLAPEEALDAINVQRLRDGWQGE